MSEDYLTKVEKCQKMDQKSEKNDIKKTWLKKVFSDIFQNDFKMNKKLFWSLFLTIFSIPKQKKSWIFKKKLRRTLFATIISAVISLSFIPKGVSEKPQKSLKDQNLTSGKFKSFKLMIKASIYIIIESRLKNFRIFLSLQLTALYQHAQD